MPALRTTVELVAPLEFADHDTQLANLRHSLATLTALQTEFWDGVSKPKASRRAKLGEEYMAEGIAVQTTLETISSHLFAEIRRVDAFANLMMEVKQLAWMARNTAGDASLLVSQGLAAGHLPADARQKYATNSAAAAALWTAIEDALYGVDLPRSFTDRIATAKQQFFAPDYLATRERMLNALITGDKPEMTVDQWTPYTVARLGAMLDVAEAALNTARDQAASGRDAETVRLALVSALLLAAILLSGASIMAVRRPHHRGQPAGHSPAARAARCHAEACQWRPGRGSAVHRSRRRDRRAGRRTRGVPPAGRGEGDHRTGPAGADCARSRTPACDGGPYQ